MFCYIIDREGGVLRQILYGYAPRRLSEADFLYTYFLQFWQPFSIPLFCGKHPILPKLGAFKGTFTKNSPNVPNWAHWSLKTHPSLYQNCWKCTPKRWHIPVHLPRLKNPVPPGLSISWIWNGILGKYLHYFSTFYWSYRTWFYCKIFYCRSSFCSKIPTLTNFRKFKGRPIGVFCR